MHDVRVRCRLMSGLLLLGLFACDKPPPLESYARIDRSEGTNTSSGGRQAMPPQFDSGTREDGGTAPDATTTPPPPFSKAGLLSAVAGCVQGQLKELQTQANALSDAAAALAKTPSADTKRAAQRAWLSTMQVMQRVEVMRLGPAAPLSAPGGQGLRDQIYIFPLANPCLVDQQLVDRAYADADFPDSLANGRGLSALEYLLFHDDESNACSDFAAINQNGSWLGLGAEELTQRRADYAKAAAADVLSRVRALTRAWSTAGDNFAEKLSLPGQGDSPYGDQTAALNAVSDALFYVEKEVKDYKLGWPLGYVDECLQAPATCPDAIESPYSGAALEHIRQNLIGFRLLFEGCDAGYSGLGIDDWLHEEGETELSTRVLSAVLAALENVDAMEASLSQAIRESPPSEVAALHAAIKTITDPLKTEVVTVLDVALPATAQGDND